MVSLARTKTLIYRSAALAILLSTATLFIILSCQGESMQFSPEFGFHASSTQTCEEHVSQPGVVHTDKSIFDGVTLPEGKVLLAAVFLVAFFFLFPKLPERYSRPARIAINYHKRKRWVWARRSPFASFSFFPYLAAVRDH